MIYELEDGISGKLEAIRLIAPELAREQVSKGGNAIRRSMRAGMMRHRHHWFARKDSDGNLYLARDKSKSKRLGQRFTRDGKPAQNPSSMANLITSYLDEKNGMLVVGGKHPSFSPIIRKNGKVAGKGARVKAVGGYAFSIIHKLSSGKSEGGHGWYMNGKLVEQKDMPRMKNVKFIKRDFMRKGISASRSKFNSYITTEYDNLFKQTIQNEKVKVKVRKFA
ncbi:MAG: hypothetical protein U9O83_01630 [Campylobacterota bacterium]|nr:hypothetical protein [Campylobacterota bacterium]